MKRLAALTAVFLLLFTLVAQAQVRKTELVYAKLDAQGALQDLYIVNAFEADAAETLTDYGDYSEVLNLSDSAPLHYQEQAVQLELAPGRSYYQGKPSQQQLPWRFAVAYSLDGKAVAPAELSGAEGLLEMRLDISLNPDLVAFARASTLQLSITLDGDRCLNIDAPKATLAYAGGNIVLSYVLLPGQEAGYRFSAQVRDFAMPGMQIAGLRMVMDADQYKKAMEVGMAGNPLAQAIGPVIENFVKGLEGENPVSFADSRNGELNSLQFIILSEGIAEKPKPVESPAAELPEEETILTRFLAFFGS